MPTGKTDFVTGVLFLAHSPFSRSAGALQWWRR